MSLFWNEGPSPKDGRWYWVKAKNGNEFPALACKESVNGWTNEDTWEDFYREVIAWKKIWHW